MLKKTLLTATRIVLGLALAYALFIGLMALIFSSSTSDIDYHITQDIGGSIRIFGSEIDHYEFCEYDIEISYSTDNSHEYRVGKMAGLIYDIDTCEKMAPYVKKSIYSGIQINKHNGQYKMEFSDGENAKHIYTSNNLKQWNKL